MSLAKSKHFLSTLLRSPRQANAVLRGRRITAVLLLSLFAVTGCEAAVPEGTSFYRGRIEHGGAFGVKIGDTRVAARTSLSRELGISYAGTEICDSTDLLIVTCQSGRDSVDIYSVRQGIRRGNLLLTIRQERVVAIGWSFRLLPSIDS
jgi:hypothetical protein